VRSQVACDLALLASYFQFGGSRYEEVEKASVLCTVLPGIECFGERAFRRGGFPCVK